MMISKIKKNIISLINRLWGIQFFRFLVVGGINTAFGYGVFTAFILLNVHYTIAALLAQICGVVFNFNTYGMLVFKNKNYGLIFKFIGVYVITYFINIGLLKIFNIYGIGNIIAEAIILLPVAFLGFFLNKQLVFNKITKIPPVDPGKY